MSSQRTLFATLVVMLLSTAVLLCSCTNYSRQRGVKNTWRSINQSEIVPGTTTQTDIVKRLGPPSQIIDLAAGPAFYYLTEQTQGGGVILILFNHLEETITYDRAVFFFDASGVLTEYSLSKETIDYDAP